MRGNDATTKVHFKGKDDDFIVMVDSAKAVQDWKKDSSIPLAQVVSGWKVFVTHKLVSYPWVEVLSEQAHWHVC